LSLLKVNIKHDVNFRDVKPDSTCRKLPQYDVKTILPLQLIPHGSSGVEKYVGVTLP
jgi:hypothetical protein